LIWADSVKKENYGLFEVERKFFVLVKNIPSSMELEIIHEKLDKTWEKIPCKLFEKIGNSFLYS
jgi:hypothetical protein